MSVKNEMDLITPNSPTYYLFKEYSIAIKDFLSNVLYLERFSLDKQPRIYYSTPRRAWAKYVQPIVNGFSDVPVCVFDLQSIEHKKDEIMNGFATISDPHPTDNNKIRKSYAPNIFKLGYDITFWTKNLSDADILATQILLYSMQPKVWATKVDNAWAEIYVDDISIDSQELEPGDAATKVIRRDLKAFVRRAYLPRESYDVYKINNILIDIDLNDKTEKTRIE